MGEELKKCHRLKIGVFSG